MKFVERVVSVGNWVYLNQCTNDYFLRTIEKVNFFTRKTKHMGL